MDIKELRDRAATLGSDYLTDEEWVEVIDRLEAAEKERDALRTKVEAMEKQEPVAAQHRFRHPQKQSQIGLYGSRAQYQNDRRGQSTRKATKLSTGSSTPSPERKEKTSDSRI
jgi:hypothetical protein